MTYGVDFKWESMNGQGTEKKKELIFCCLILWWYFFKHNSQKNKVKLQIFSFLFFNITSSSYSSQGYQVQEQKSTRIACVSPRQALRSFLHFPKPPGECAEFPFGFFVCLFLKGERSRSFSLIFFIASMRRQTDDTCPLMLYFDLSRMDAYKNKLHHVSEKEMLRTELYR